MIARTGADTVRTNPVSQVLSFLLLFQCVLLFAFPARGDLGTAPEVAGAVPVADGESEADTAPPTMAETVPPAGSTVDELAWVEVVFDEAVTGVTAESLLVNGVAAGSVTRSSPDHYVFSFAPPAAGTVRFAWAAAHGIVDLAAVPNAFRGGDWTVTLDPAASRKHLRISEVMADNDRTLYDDDCDRPDWIEIHNAGPTAVNLAGWALTDDAGEPGKWRFPAFSLAADGYLVVFASQKNKTNLPARVATACRSRTNAVASFHTNFRLDPNGEYLGLTAPNGEVISEFKPAYPPQPRDVSYGTVAGAVANFGYFVTPTPRRPNSATGAGFAPDVTFSRAGGVFVHGFPLELRCAHPQATIRYTVDGTFPAETNRNLRTYSGALRITNTTQVRARAWAPGLLPGAPSSETYLGLTNRMADLASFTSSLPIVVMTTLKTATIRDSVNTPVHFSIFEPRNGLTTLLDRPTMQTRGGAKTRGSSTGGQPQSNFAVEWWDEFDQDRDSGVLGMPEDSEWVLYAPNEFDAALIHNPFTMELSRQMNFAAPRTRFVEVYLNRGGLIRSNDWFGLYVLMEKPGLSGNRIDAPKAQPEDVELPEVTGSYLFKTDRLDPGDTGFSAGGAVNGYVEPKEREMRAPQRAPQLAYLTQYFRDMDNALRATNPDFRHPTRGYRGYLEVTNWVDFHMLETLSGQVDAIRLSTYFYKRREGKVEYGPRWDYDRAWESKGDGRDDNPRVWDTGGGLFGSPWWPRLFADRDAWQLWIDRWQMYRRSVFSQTNMFAVIDRMTNQIGATQPREARRWTATAPRGSYRAEIGIMKTWISNRLAWVDLQMAQPPRFSSMGGRVSAGFQLVIEPPTSVSSPANVAIFYTLDGTDPRPPVGTNPPTSLRYSGPITITANTRVIARVRDNGRTQRSGPPVSTPWSSPVSATFVVTPPTLLVTELMYHPEAPPADSIYEDKDFEFIELLNAGGEPVELAGSEFTDGISYRFDATSGITRLLPGERVLIVGHREAFLTRYPGATRIAGQFTGSLADEGERLVLTGPAGEVVFDFEYGGFGPTRDEDWPANTKGLGFSLVLNDEAVPPGTLGDPGRWRSSARAGGSPGTLDGAPRSPSPPVVVSEVLADPPAGADEWIELHNPANVPADIGGWWLSDDLEQPHKARLPLGTRIAPGGYLLIGRSVYDSGPNAFGLSREGDQIWLFAADVDGNLTGYFDGFRFGASAPNRSFGRFADAASIGGAPQFLALREPTPGSPNALPVVGPVVVNEFQTRRSIPGRSDSVRDEFIELRNISAQSVALFDAAQPGRTWRIRGDVEFELPAGLVLAPNAVLVVVGFDPILDVTARAAFETRHSLHDDVVFVGPWRGGFSDDLPPSLRLLRPGQPAGADGTGGSFLVVDEFRSGDWAAFPWATEGQSPGRCFVRASASAPGTTGLHWNAGWPTPGDLDDDLDGLPDAWERRNGFSVLPAQGAVGTDGAAGDPDGDGYRNIDEFHNRTDPRDGGDVLAVRHFSEPDGRRVFLADGPGGRRFELQTRTVFNGGAWQTLRAEVSDGNGAVALVTGFPGEAARYFRVEASP